LPPSPFTPTPPRREINKYPEAKIPGTEKGIKTVGRGWRNERGSGKKEREREKRR
jgi:hypothetical protein